MARSDAGNLLEYPGPKSSNELRAAATTLAAVPERDYSQDAAGLANSRG